MIWIKSNCPKCKVIGKKLSMKNIDFIEADCIANTDYIEILLSKGFRSMPVLQVGEQYFDFAQANKWIGEQ